MQQTFQINTITTSTEFFSLQEAWDDLCRRSGANHFFQSFIWCWNVWNLVAHKRDRKLQLVVARQDDRLVLIWPLMLEGRSLRLLSSDTLEYRDMIVEKNPLAKFWMTEAWSHVKQIKNVDLFLFQNLRMPSNVDKLFGDWLGQATVSGGWCPVIRLDSFADWSDYAKQLPKSLISDQRRQWLRAKEVLPELCFKVVDDDDEIKSTIDWIIDNKLKWLTSRNKKAISFSSNEMRSLFQQVAKSANGQNSLVLAKLANADTIISAGFGYQFGNDFLFHVFAYDLNWHRLSPSRLFLERLVQWCFDAGIKTFDFMPGDEPYKKIWATDLIRTDSYMGSLTLLGSISLHWHSLRSKGAVLKVVDILRRVYVHLPNGLRLAIQSKASKLNLTGYGLDPRPKKPILAMKMKPPRLVDAGM